MRKTLTILVGVLLLGSDITCADSDNFANQSPAELKAGIEGKHPAAYYMLAAQLFKNTATKQEAVFWFYVGQLRYRYYLAANPDLPPDGDPALFASFSEVIGRPINEYAGGVPDIWIAEINQALKWDAAHDNGFTSKSKSPDNYRQIRAGLGSMRDQLAGMKDKLPEMRQKNGLKDPVR
ncbi:MAG: hypothetical protein M3Q46_09480 [Verrucomicrobiota bacterium]|nr:hypothetical protein [Verrucomicrobiota bacterium]